MAREPPGRRRADPVVGPAAVAPPRPVGVGGPAPGQHGIPLPLGAHTPDGTIVRTGFGGYVRSLNRDARAGNIAPFAVEVDGELAGQVHLFGVMRGSLLSGAAGYWLGERFAGQGVATRALAALIDYALGPFGLHRVEVNIRPENVASLAVVAHLKFREEGVRERYLHIEGDWRDHRTFALTVDDLGGLPTIERWHLPG